MTRFQPPFTLTGEIASLMTTIGEQVGRLIAQPMDVRLRRVNRIRNVAGSLAIEGNTLTEQQIMAILHGKRIVAPPREILEARNALAAYERLPEWDGLSETDLLAAHRTLMDGLLDAPGRYRGGGVGVMAGAQVVHMAPPAKRVPALMAQLFAWLRDATEHPLIASSVFHYEFEFIHPFADGNGRMGRLWQTLLLSRWQPAFAWLPVESMVHVRQAAYYAAIRSSTLATDSAPFIQFMLESIHEALLARTPQEAPHVTPQVADLLRALRVPLTRAAVQQALGMRDRKSFRLTYLAPALSAGLVEMTMPDKPSSRHQRYRLTPSGQQALKTLRNKTQDGGRP